MNSIFKKYPSNKRIFKDGNSEFDEWENNACIFGLAFQNSSLKSIDEIPIETKSIRCYFGEGNFEILENLIQNGFHERIEHLTIGFEHGNYKYGYKNYSKISELISNVEFLKLKTFDFGYDFLIVNEDKFYPSLGNITSILKNMPNLEILNLWGVFELESNFKLKHLKEFSASSYWLTEEDLARINHKTLQHLLNSEFPLLEDFYLDLDVNRYERENEKYIYEFDEKFFNKINHELKSISIEGLFQSGTKDRLIKALEGKTKNLFLEGIKEVE